MTTTERELTSIRDAQRRIRDRIRAIKQQLQDLEGIPDSHPWISLRRVKTIEELRSPQRSLREALNHDIQILRSKLRELQADVRNTRIRGAQREKKRFEQDLERKLKEGESKGYMTDAEMESMRKDSEAVLKKFVDILNAYPSERNISNVVKNLEAPLIFGSDAEKGNCREAFNSLKNNSELLVKQKEERFRSNPTVENFDATLKTKETAIMVGGNVGFEKPSDLKSVNAQHIVSQGESLSSISKHYYGKTGYWDIIYLYNAHIIGNNPNELKTGISLKIP